MDARDGVQTGLVQYALVNRTAVCAKLSRFGVCTTVFPAAPRQSRLCWSGIITSTFFGLSLLCRESARFEALTPSAIVPKAWRRVTFTLLERNLYGHLNDARRQGAANYAGLSSSDGCVGNVEISSIKCIEPFRT